MNPGWVIRKDFWSENPDAPRLGDLEEILDGPQLGDLEGFLVGICDGAYTTLFRSCHLERPLQRG